jgi:phage terminase Nu1 subunit (DNA packaging protein)
MKKRIINIFVASEVMGLAPSEVCALVKLGLIPFKRNPVHEHAVTFTRTVLREWLCDASRHKAASAIETKLMESYVAAARELEAAKASQRNLKPRAKRVRRSGVTP